jgi:peptidoglycan/LPS O-acetylase OafA/YrhL
MTVPPASRDKILPLTSLRFFVAFALMVGHNFRNAPSLAKATGWLPNLLDHVFVLCSFFFFLSGFVLALAHLPAAPGNGGGASAFSWPSVKKFWLTRFSRLYPLYIAAMVIDFPHYLHVRSAMPAQAGAGWTQVLINSGVNLTTLQAWFPAYNSLVCPSWAVGIEVFFYLVFPWAGAWVWQLRPRSAGAFAAMAFPGGFALVMLSIHFQVDIYVIKYNPVLHLFEFMLGILLARAYLSLLSRGALVQSLTRWAVPMAAISVVAVGAVMAIGQLGKTPYLLLQHGLLLPFFAIIILAFASASRSISAVFSFPALVVLGEASYGIFLLHYPLSFIFRHAVLRYDWPLYGLTCLLVVGLSVLSFYYLEIPLRGFLMARLTGDRSTGALVPQPAVLQPVLVGHTGVLPLPLVH